MILLSNLIKSSFYLSQENLITIETQELKLVSSKTPVEAIDGDKLSDERLSMEADEAQKVREEILQAAEAAAEQIINQAKKEADQLRDQALIEIEAWWNERRQQDQMTIEESRQHGYQVGLEEGTVAAQLQVNESYSGMIVEAQNILEQSFETNRKTIVNAEMFLLELSCGIAEKIILQKLDQSSEWIIDIVKQALQRSSEKGSIAICVAPAQFAYIQSVREELMHSIDPQVELHIYPDASIKDAGCVIKTSFGTIDARVETQLTEIKQALLDIARRGVEAVE
jgi:flagellar assembly protein FliH